MLGPGNLTTHLADLGAEVIKVERPSVGDDSRAFGPPWVRDGQGKETKDSAYFTSANRGKKSITLNISVPQGQAIVGALGRLGHPGVSDVRQGKRFELEVDDTVDDSILAEIAESLLANTVIEDWTISRERQ